MNIGLKRAVVVPWQGHRPIRMSSRSRMFDDICLERKATGALHSARCMLLDDITQPALARTQKTSSKSSCCEVATETVRGSPNGSLFCLR
jgi:hypothetical protein